LKILSIDTSSKICSVAVLEDTNVIIEKNIDKTKFKEQTLLIKKDYKDALLIIEDKKEDLKF